MIKPEPYLTENGKRIFKELLGMLPLKSKQQEAFTFQLSILANSLDDYQTASEYCKKNGNYQEANSGYRQVAPEFTVKQKSMDMVLRLGQKFGINPEDLKKIGASASGDNRNRESKLQKLIK